MRFKFPQIARRNVLLESIKSTFVFVSLRILRIFFKNYGLFGLVKFCCLEKVGLVCMI